LKSKILPKRNQNRSLDPQPNLSVQEEECARTYSKRAKLIGTAITLFTTAALFVCALIATLFLESFVDLNFKVPVAVLFIFAMLLLIVGLMVFLKEIFVATHNLRIGPH
jgi:hypothetical protein